MGFSVENLYTASDQAAYDTSSRRERGSEGLMVNGHLPVNQMSGRIVAFYRPFGTEVHLVITKTVYCFECPCGNTHSYLPANYPLSSW